MAGKPLKLSSREQQIADLLLQGCDNAEMAKLLKMKRRTVKAYMNRLFRRFEIKDGIKRVKLATLLYRRFHSGANSEASGFAAIGQGMPLNSSLSAGPPVAPVKWQRPSVEPPTTRDANPNLNVRLTA